MMKQKCLRNRDVVNEDRISELPEALLLKILSSVPTKNVIATSVLSKQWRSLWKMVPNLMFNSERHGSKHHRFSEIVSRSLLSHKAPVLESLHLVVRDESEALDVIGIAFAHKLHNVRKLVLDLRTWRCVSFPNVLWSCDNTTLETLELKNSILLKFPSPVCFKSLKKLHLDYVIFDDEESVSNLFSGCPRLEDLFLNTRGDVEGETFTIDVTSLQRLTIVDYYGDGVGRCVIIAPSLKYLNISAHDWIESCLINAPEVVEAEINVGHSIENENILASLVSVRRLFLKSPLREIKFPTGIIYHQLVSLELSTEEDWDLLPLMLESSPKLQILKLTDPILGEKDWHDGWEWSEPKRVPECLLFELETFVWTGYEWQREEEKEVALYILKNARRLKKAFISAKYIKPAKLEKRREESLQKLDKRREALEKLEKRREALEKLEKKREEALQKLEKRREALEKLEKKRKESLQKLDKRREALQKLEKRREALQKLDKRREALQKLGKRREALQKLGKRREESLQKLGKRREESLQKLEKRREALQKLDKRLEEALEKLEKRREEALEKLEKRRVEALEKLASEVKVYNSSCHLVLKCEPYH